MERLKIPQPYSAAEYLFATLCFLLHVFITTFADALSYGPVVLGDGLFLKDDISKEIPRSIAVV